MTEKKTLAITLLRGFEYIIAPSSKQDYTHKKGSQCLGKSTYQLAVFPHKGNWQDGKVYQEALNFNNSLSLIQTGRAKGNLPIEMSFLKITPDDLVFSALKKAEDENNKSFVLRIYNPTDKAIDGKVQFFKKIKNVARVTLEEIHLTDMKIFDENSFVVSLEEKKIGTYKIKF